jgi:hypothetical protein
VIANFGNGAQLIQLRDLFGYGMTLIEPLLPLAKGSYPATNLARLISSNNPKRT